ncbi:unnamed protein product [Prorocentrum cordatum]|uniref:PPM-type phosphatase domain-containing protein n=1 Tax=Prorocentrum cordatum TaxID=2364126 RepID=A0ABN9SVW6_9DINO|nr:unnamed protein product [Polarella glacialis]
MLPGMGGMESITASEEVELIRSGLAAGFEAADREFLALAGQYGWGDGATALVALVCHGFEADLAAGTPGTVPSAPGGQAKLFAAWCGTGRMLLLRGRQAISCSREHLCAREDERARLAAAGALLVQDHRGAWWAGRPDRPELVRNRQQGYEDAAGPRCTTAASRGFGDLLLKQPPAPVLTARARGRLALAARARAGGAQGLPRWGGAPSPSGPGAFQHSPDVHVVDLVPEDWAIVLAGHWLTSRLSEQEVADICWDAMAVQGGGPVEAAQALTRHALHRGAEGNATAIVMRLGWRPTATCTGCVLGRAAAAPGLPQELWRQYGVNVLPARGRSMVREVAPQPATAFRPFGPEDEQRLLDMRGQSVPAERNPGVRFVPNFLDPGEGRGGRARRGGAGPDLQVRLGHGGLHELRAGGAGWPGERRGGAGAAGDDARRAIVPDPKGTPGPMRRITGRTEDEARQHPPPWGYGAEFRPEALPLHLSSVVERIRSLEGFPLGPLRDVTINSRTSSVCRLDPHIDPLKDGANCFILTLLSGAVLTFSPVAALRSEADRATNPAAFGMRSFTDLRKKTWTASSAAGPSCTSPATPGTAGRTRSARASRWSCPSRTAALQDQGLHQRLVGHSREHPAAQGPGRTGRTGKSQDGGVSSFWAPGGSRWSQGR